MQIFQMVDADGNGVIDKNEVLDLFKNANGRGSGALKYFASMDVDNNGQVNMEEYLQFWKQVIRSGVAEKAIQAELQALVERCQLLVQIRRISSTASTQLSKNTEANFPAISPSQPKQVSEEQKQVMIEDKIQEAAELYDELAKKQENKMSELENTVVTMQNVVLPVLALNLKKHYDAKIQNIELESQKDK